MAHCAKINLTDIDLMYLQKIYFEKTWAWWLNHIGTFVVFIIGFCGNILCLIVLCRRPFIRNSYTQYLIALAIVDAGAISSEAISALDEFHQYQSIEKRTFIQHNVLSCKLYYYIRFILYSMSSWVIVALAVERLVAIKFPLWSKHICSVTNARRIIFIIFLFTMIIQSYHFIVKGLDCSSTLILNSTNNCRCKTLPGYAKIDIFFTIYLWRLILMTLLPITIIITVNILIMNKLFNKKSLIDHSCTAINARRKIIFLHKISRMLIIISSIYLVLHVPGSSLEIIKFIFIHAFKLCNIKWQYYIHITQDIFDLLTNCNYGINFYLYIISSKHIRNEFIHKYPLFCFSKSKHNENFPRSHYFTSSYIHVSKKKRQYCSNTKLARGETISSA